MTSYFQTFAAAGEFGINTVSGGQIIASLHAGGNSATLRHADISFFATGGTVPQDLLFSLILCYNITGGINSTFTNVMFRSAGLPGGLSIASGWTTSPTMTLAGRLRESFAVLPAPPNGVYNYSIDFSNDNQPLLLLSGFSIAWYLESTNSNLAACASFQWTELTP